MEAIFIGTRIELFFARPQARSKNKQNEICMKVTIFRTKKETESGFPFEDCDLFFIVIRQAACYMPNNMACIQRKFGWTNKLICRHVLICLDFLSLPYTMYKKSEWF